MYVKVRTMDGRDTNIITISKLTTVQQFRSLINDAFNVIPDRQRLFYRGKQMENGHTMFDYDVNVNDVIQLMVKPVLQEIGNVSEADNKKKKESLNSINDKENIERNGIITEISEETESKFYRVGDLVDAQYLIDGTWWESKIIKIIPNKKCTENTEKDDGLHYCIQYETYSSGPIDDEIKLCNIRPRARRRLALAKLSPSDIIMVNYNLEEPKERGFWYDFKVEKVSNKRSDKSLVGTIFVANGTAIDNCEIVLLEELFEIEKHVPVNSRGIALENSFTVDSPTKRENGPTCTTCKDNPKRKCKDCGCHTCYLKDNPDKQLMCDECDAPYHIYCLDPPLDSIPDVNEWFCPLCKNDDSEIVRAGEKLKSSKKKTNMISARKGGRDWGKGMACAGRTKECTMVPKCHFGPIPGVEVGTMWRYRLQASEAGVHRPPVSGIHGKDKFGAYSIALSGGYEDDKDNGDEFYYTGSGGRDLSGNKRTAEQSSDQLLTLSNKALAMNCNTSLNKDGSEAKDWRGGKPVRVIRNCKLSKHSKYAPEEGNRYDGIYKVVKYWQQTGQAGFKVWRFLFRRDDESPAPWTKAGQKRTEELGLKMQYPDGYLEAEAQKKALNKSQSQPSSEDEDENDNKKRGRKRKNAKDASSPPPKKQKSAAYSIESQMLSLIDDDSENEKTWTVCKLSAEEGKVNFINTVETEFLCICCQILVFKPVTTPCQHNVCLTCIQRSFKADVYSCPACRHELGKKYSMEINSSLRKCLQKLFAGYEAGR